MDETNKPAADASAYNGQDRGSADAYRRYLDGMDASMKQKVALAAAHLLCSGRVADMGMGSGTGSDALAALYPQLSVTGVDVNESMVETARKRYQRPNLTFIRGDISESVFPQESLSAIVNSSVLHHVTSFNGYRKEEVLRALKAQYRQLMHNGIILVRDFVAAEDEEVLLDLPSNDGDDSSNPSACSTAALFRLFSKQFRSLLDTPGFVLKPIPDSLEKDMPEGFERFQCTARVAAEFLLRKDYRADWDSEIKEEYTYFTQQEFEGAFVALGLRVLASVPLHNPWIVRNRFEGKARLRALDGKRLPFPATNYIICGEKVDETRGVRFQYRAPCPKAGFLEMLQYRHKETGQIRDLVRRPNRTLDIIPWFYANQDLFVQARKSYPRPLVQACPESGRHIDGSRPVGYVNEPLNVIQTDRPIGNSVEQALSDRAGLLSEDLGCFEEGTTYYPSPGGIMEEIRSVFVEIPPTYTGTPIDGLSGFSTSGTVQAMETRQLLRAAQVGGLPDARLELNVYHLLRRMRSDPGPWIGEAIRISECPDPFVVYNLSTPILGRRKFTKVKEHPDAKFLQLLCASFAEENAEGKILFERPLEYVVPAYLSTNTISVSLIRKHKGVHYMGIVDDDLPAAQGFTGNSNLLVTPAWRLPRSVEEPSSAFEWIRDRLVNDHGIVTGEVFTLGGNYFPSPGVTPENVTPLCFEVQGESKSAEPLLWIPLRDIVENEGIVRDGHLRIAANRTAHALGLLK